MSARDSGVQAVPAVRAPGGPDVTANDVGAALARLRERRPLVQCLTNIVAAPLTANVLLAVGASPAMVDNPHEARDFATVADGVLVNVGTPQDDTALAMRRAVAGATASGTPWVLDPVAVGGLAWRTALATELVAAASPAVIRGNASEILGLAGGRGGRGPDTVDTPETALPAALALARRHATVVAVSGPVDLLTDGYRVVRVANGTDLLTTVSGAGCALGALIAAFAAVEADPLRAAVAATAVLTVAADAAAAGGRGPGSFAVGVLDELYRLTPAGLTAQVRLRSAA
ncbi:MAG: hydroxyethylthiazole kinase [Actinotalea sp.]|nr:hydroxyethylthiazole kinase [Actinotalea sp.]